jgi:hypothetical protein
MQICLRNAGTRLVLGFWSKAFTTHVFFFFFTLFDKVTENTFSQVREMQGTWGLQLSIGADSQRQRLFGEVLF